MAIAEQPLKQPEWSPTRFGRVVNLEAPKSESLLPADFVNLHTTLRSLKNAFVGYQDATQDEDLIKLQDRICLSCIADLLRASGLMNPEQVPLSNTILSDLVDLGISVEPLVLANRPPLSNANLVTTALDGARIETILAKSRGEPIPNASSVFAFGVLSQGALFGYSKMLNLLTQNNQGQETLAILNNNFGLGAVKREPSGVKAGISLRLLENALNGFDNPAFELWICDDTIVRGETFHAFAGFFRDTLSRKVSEGKMTNEQMDFFMSRMKFFTYTQRTFDFTKTDSHYIWEVKPVISYGQNLTIKIKV